MLKFDFDYINMRVVEGSSYITEQYLELDESKLRSIICYFKLSYARRRILRHDLADRIELAGEAMQQQRAKGRVKAPFDAYFEKVYHEVKLEG